MSLESVLICCDDGCFYSCGEEVIVGDGWRIFLEDDDFDTFRVPAHPRPKGQPRNIPRPMEDPQSLIDRDGVPVTLGQFIGHETRGSAKQVEEAVYACESSGPFPRRLLPPHWTPKQPKNVFGVLAFCTDAHLHVLDAAREEWRQKAR